MLRSLLPPEAQLVFLCGGGPENDDAIRALLQRELDWGVLCVLAQREHAAPAVAHRLASMALGRELPAGVMNLRRLAAVTTFKMQYLQRRVAESVAALDRAGIKGVLLKGAALATTAYGSFGERPMTDVDLLVPAGDAPAALQVLLATGWLWRPDRDQDGDFEHLHHLPALLDARGMEVSLELHKELLPMGHPFAFSAESVLDAASMTDRMPGAWIPAPQHMLLHSCIHFAWGHLFRKGAWNAFRDVQATIRAFDIDWPAFVALADASHARTCCYWTFRLARDLMGVQIPPHVLSALRPPLPEFVLRRLARHFTLILVPSGVSCPSVSVRRFMWSAGILPRWSGHAGTRRWQLLQLLPEHRAARGADPSVALEAETSPANAWLQYCRTVLLEAKSPWSPIS
ncbi:MAG TPA: nucleotidyltransferase family protein [Gemmatimonadaceae bacterium]|nr:nucleotidyltransferase family protein [Gemmatimonadaceae bacterium]